MYTTGQKEKLRSRLSRKVCRLLSFPILLRKFTIATQRREILHPTQPRLGVVYCLSFFIRDSLASGILVRERAWTRTIFTCRRVFRALYYPWRQGGSTGSLTPTLSNIKPQNGRKGKALTVTLAAHLQQQLVPWHCFLILGTPGKGLVSQGNPGQKTCYRHQSEHHLETLQRKVTTLG